MKHLALLVRFQMTDSSEQIISDSLETSTYTSIPRILIINHSYLVISKCLRSSESPLKSIFESMDSRNPALGVLIQEVSGMPRSLYFSELFNSFLIR